MFYKNNPMDMGDIFSYGFELLKKTIKSSAIIVLVFMLPAAVILSVGFKSLIGNIPLDAESQMDPDAALAFMSGMAGYIGSLVIYMLLYLAAWIGVISLAGKVMRTEHCSAGDAFRDIFSVTFFKLLGQFILIGLAMMGIMAAPFVLIAIGTATQTSLVIIVGIFVMIAAVVYMIYLIYRWYFGGVHIILSGGGVMDSLSKSSHLVKFYWWRTFGILLLISIIVQFAVSIISTPLFFLFMWDLILAMFSSPESFEHASEVAPMLLALFEKIGYIIAFTSALQLLVTPLFTVVMYFDLRIRKNDINGELPAPENPFSPEPSFGSRS